ncbi:MAG: glutamate-cysteine ligase family protein [Acidobacteriota bacterium]
MGEHSVRVETEPEELRLFMQRVLDDVVALEQMLDGGLFESDPIRIGAEQELFLVDPQTFRPSFAGMEVLEAVDDDHFTTELGRFNLECNLDPQVLGAGALSRMESQLRQMLDLVRSAARSVGAEVLLMGILPTLEKSDLSLDDMAPIPRYYALAEAMRRMRGGDFRFHIKGRDELTVRHDNVMVEACNTSFQVHLQTDPAEFASLYNTAMTVSAPVLAASCFSPMLFGRVLWAETRIALFQQAVDTRRGASHHRTQRPRVRFGDGWIDDSVLEIFRQDISHFRLLLTTEADEDPTTVLERGEIPQLSALRLHNGTVYRWNRACYGIGGGKPHLRIENRILPSGPSVLDEMANMAFWLGLMKSIADEGDVRQRIGFDQVRDNFLAASRLGLETQLHWLDGVQHAAQELMISELLPRAAAGLDALGVSTEEQERYLPVIEERAKALRTGSRWMISSLDAMERQGTAPERLACITRAALENQLADRPVHTWEPASLRREDDEWYRHYEQVGNLMSTALFTVSEEDVIDLVASMMDWRYIHHVPVEDAEHRLVGLVTHRTLLRWLARNQGRDRRPVAVSEVMVRDLVTVTRDTPTLDAIELMRKHRIASLPVVDGDQLIGIVTERDFIQLSSKLLEDFLRR